MVQYPEQLVHGVGAKGVPHLGAVKRNTDGALINSAVVGHVRQVKTTDLLPARGIENG